MTPYILIHTNTHTHTSHDDITYASIARAFSLPLILHGPTAKRMRRLSRPETGFDWAADTPQRTAKLRMARFPLSRSSGADVAEDDTESTRDSVIFVEDNLWVPVVVVNGNIHVLPGVPQLCTCALCVHTSTCLSNY